MSPGRPLRALITGAGQRLGRHLAEALGRRSAQVALHYHQSQGGAQQAARQIEENGGQALLFSRDLRQPNEARGLVSDAVAALGGLDLLVLSAANFERVPFEALDDDALNRALDLNLRAPYAMSLEAAPHLKQSRGSIVLLTCVSSTNPFRSYLPYSIAKGAARQLMLGLAKELAPEVRVNAIAPGTVLPQATTSAEELDRLAGKTLLGHIGSPSNIEQALLYLLDSDFVTGQELVVDGGRT